MFSFPLFFIQLSSFASKEMALSLILFLQAALSVAICYHDCWSMFAWLNDSLNWSLYRSFGLPLGRFPLSSSPYSMILSSLVEPIRRTCPDQRIQCFKIVASTLGSETLFWISSFGQILTKEY